MYGRTGIKKGYNGLSLEKVATEAYARLAATTTESDYNTAAQQFQTVIDRAQKEAKHSFEDTYYASADVALLSDAFVDNAAELLLKRLKEPIREVKETFNPAVLLKNQPVLFIPSGALTGFNDSPLVKASFDEYVKAGGTLIVLSQKHGYDYASIPTPDGKPIAGYGWEEDINCFADAFTINSWHQMLSGQRSATPTANVDGYFTSIPDKATVLMRRTANDQPALFMYEHGAGRVIVSSMYSDWAYGHGQTSSDEIALIRDMLSWAKKPAILPELKPGEAASVPVTVTNSTATDAVVVKLQIWNPDRSALLSEQTLGLAISPGQSAQTTVTWQSGAGAALGIYHIDYILLDSVGAVIQPQAETDSGRFVISNPPASLLKSPDFSFVVNSDSERYASGSDAAFTVTMYNNTDAEKTITARYFFPHHWGETRRPDSGGDWNTREMNLQKTLSVPAKGSASFSHVLANVSASIDRLWAYFYDESGKEIGGASRGFWVFSPSLDIGLQPDKTLYARGDTVNLTLNLRNRQSVTTNGSVTVRVSDPLNLAVYVTTLNLALAANESRPEQISFPLPATAQAGTYTISVEAFDAANNKIGGDSAGFEIPLRLVTLTPSFPAGWQAGANPLSFNLTNLGVMPVTTGLLGVTLTDPDGAAVATVSQPFTLDAGQAKNPDLFLAIPPLKFGVYTLAYSQSDETGPGRNNPVTLANSVAISASFDKPSYRIRETANLALTLSNSGRFNLAGLSVSVAAPDAGYSATETVNLMANQSILLNKMLPIPETVAAGQHSVIVTLTLPGGSAIAKSFTITVPDSFLAFSMSQSAVTAGGSITAQFVNSGGRDTSAEYRLTLYDAKSVQIADQIATASVQAGATLSLSLPIPLGATDGVYTIIATYRDAITGQAATVQKLLSVSGIKGALTLRSDKPAYLVTEVIAALSDFTNSGTDLLGGNLHLQVSTAVGSQKQKTWTSKSDFQLGVREGVDTYGLNDWLIPDYDFNGTTVDTNKWVPFGSVREENGKLLVDSTNGHSGISSAWKLEGDFDFEIEFSENRPYNQKGAELFFSAFDGSFYNYIKNTASYGYESGAVFGNSQYNYNRTGGVIASGKFRAQRTDTTITTYYWDGSGWIQFLKSTHPMFTKQIVVTPYMWGGYASQTASVLFDNFKLNYGRIAAVSETADSVRLLPLNDNFDDGVISADRWSVRSSGSVTTNETNGSLVTADTQTGVQSYANVAGRFPLEGDFDISIDWKMPVASASGDWSSGFQINELDQNTVLDSSLVGNALQIKRAYINGLGHIYQTGHYNGTAWDFWSSPVTTTNTSGKFRIKRTGSSVTVWYWNNSLNRWEWNGNTAGYTWGSTWATPSYVQIGTTNNLPAMPAEETEWNNFKVVSGAAYTSKGTIRMKQDAGQTSNWQTVNWNSTEPIGTSIKFRTRTAETDTGLATAAWSDYLAASGSPITSPKARWIEVEATLTTTNTSITPILNDVTVTYGSSQGDILWQTDVPVNMAQSATDSLHNTIGNIGSSGKYYLQGSLTSSTGQSVSTAEYPFFVSQGNTLLSFSSDKRIYKSGETVSIRGEIKNLATVEAANLNLNLKGKPSAGAEQTLYSATFTIPAGGSRLFNIAAPAGADGTVALTGTVTQNGATLAEIADQYEVASPMVTATLAAPDTVGNDPFAITLNLINSGKTEALVNVASSFTSQLETVTIPAGQTKLLQYSRQITADTTDTFTFSDDLTQVVTKAIKYGPAVTLAPAPQAIYPEGKIALPVTISNSGLIDGAFTIDYRLDQGATIASQQTKSHFLAKGAATTDSLTFDLTEGSYQLAATSQKPVAASSTTFRVRKETKAELALSVGAQSGDLLPATVTVTNLGFNPIEGSVRLYLMAENGPAAWTAVREVVLHQALNPDPRALAFAINLAPLKPGSYTVKAELLDTGNRQLAAQSAPFMLLGPTFVITRLPEYRTIPAGGSSDFTFRVKNSGNQEGAFDLSFKADDLIDSTRSEWLKPGEEKEIVFTFQTAADLEEKDYSAVYRLKTIGSTVAEGIVTYRLAGIRLTVTASLDRPAYTPGDTATLTLTISQQDAGAAPQLFARVNYNGFEEKREFALSGSQTLTFNVPLAQITGEKLFYGIYHQSGRSIHLNTIYIHKADATLAITTDKQVYQPGEAVAITTSGSATGSLTMTGPGDYSASFAFAGTDTRSLVLPSSMTAGTYTITGRLTAIDGSTINVAHPFDVAGIQVKIKEALLDKARYAAADSMKLALTIESNRDMTATVRTWIVDPAGTYTPAGEVETGLSSSSPSLFTIHSSLLTGSLGIHKLVYGVYRGDLLLASGAKAFDIGEAVLFGLATDRSDYPDVSMPVTVKADLYGTVVAGIEFFLDGASIGTGNVALSGMGNHTFAIPPASLTPGLHTLKGVLTANGLTSSREVRFTYGSSLPDLVVRLSTAQPKGSLLSLTATVTNQGKTAAAATTLAISDGNPEQEGTTIATLAVPPLAAGASVTIAHDWHLLGKAGEHLLYGQVDPENLVAEFIEANNGAIGPVSIPNLTLGVSTNGASFRANSDVGIAVELANLGSASYQDLTLKTEIIGPVGAAGSSETPMASLSPAFEISVGNNWNTGANPPGSYRVESSLVGGGSSLAGGSASFAVEETPSVTGAMSLGEAELIQGSKLGIDYNLVNNGNIDLADGETKVEIVDKNSGTTAQTFSQPFAQLNLLQSLSLAFAVEKLDIPPGDYAVKLTAQAAGGLFPIGEKALKVLPSLEVIKQLSRSPRVLVFIGKDQGENDKELVRTENTVREALDGIGVYHAIVREEKGFERELRSRLFNCYLLAGRKPLADHLDAELAERINSGDGLILANYGPVEDGKFREVAGIDPAGSLPPKPRVLTLLESPMTHAGSFTMTGKLAKLRVGSGNVQVAAFTTEAGQNHPALVFNQYGEGKVVVFAFDPDVTLLQGAVGHVVPTRVDPVPAAPLPVELTVRSLGFQFDLRITETVDAALPILHVYPPGTVEQQKITWLKSLSSNGTEKFSYLVGLPEESGTFDLSSEISFLRGGSYGSHQSYPLTVTTDKGVVALKTDILVSLQSLAVTGRDAARLGRIIGAYRGVMEKPVFTEKQLDEAIKDLLGLTKELREMRVDSAPVRLDLDRLLRIYGRKWGELQQ